MAEIQKRYFSPLEANIKEFNKNYQKQVLEMIDKIQTECNDKLNQVLTQLEDELEINNRESVDIEKEKEKISAIRKKLIEIVGYEE